MNSCQGCKCHSAVDKDVQQSRLHFFNGDWVKSEQYNKCILIQSENALLKRF